MHGLQQRCQLQQKRTDDVTGELQQASQELGSLREHRVRSEASLGELQAELLTRKQAMEKGYYIYIYIYIYICIYIYNIYMYIIYYIYIYK